MTIEVLGASILSSTGRVLETDNAGTRKNVFSLLWTQSGWSIKAVDVA
ncbi:hypothetical protein [Intrasporangium calvum]|nr:hypothetical protein [Intrasporangium calvum]